MKQTADNYFTLLMLSRLIPAAWSDIGIASAVCDFIQERAERFGLRIKPADDNVSFINFNPEVLRLAKPAVEKRLKRFQRVPFNDLQTNLNTLGKKFGLDGTDRHILAVIGAYHTMPEVAILLDAGTSYRAPKNELLIFAAACGLSAGEVVDRAISRSSPLQRSGLLSEDHPCAQFQLDAEALRVLRGKARPWKTLKSALLGNPAATPLTWDDFSHIARERDLLCKVLGNSLRKSERGVHCLLYGPPGTGKTELCKVVAKQLNVSLYSAGEASPDGWEPSRTERGKALNLAHKLLNSDKQSLLLFDEMEDLFEFNFFDRCSRVFTHRFLELSRVPMLWTCNNIACIDPAILRRMAVSLELRVPSIKVRTKIWKKTLKTNDVAIPEQDIQELATTFPVAPSLAVNSVRVLAGLSVSKDELVTAVRGIAETLGRLPNRQHAKTHAYDPALIKASMDPEELANTLSAVRTRAITFCFYGPPGTGKSAFARYLAERMELEVIEKKASDLLSPFLGMTEKNIAEAFAEALQEKALLILDEADSFLLDRSFAMHIWEVSQVNELLARMDNCPVPVICTTNAIERIDKAALRRFHFKVEFKYLGRDQAAAAFATFFGSPPRLPFSALSSLTLGDFAVVRKKAEILGALNSPDLLVRMLLEECEAKREGTRPIGFVSSLGAEARDGATTIRKARDHTTSRSFDAGLDDRSFTR